MAGRGLKIFVVEDSEWYNKMLVYTLSLNPDDEVKSFFNGRDLLKSLDEAPDIITLDFRLPDISGLDLLQKIKQENTEVHVILVSEQGDIDTVVNLLKMGAYDYITKSSDIKDRLLNTINNIRSGVGLKREITRLRREVRKKYDFHEMLLGDSPAIKEVYALIEKANETTISVIISGETGTGKELVAKAIHYYSQRKDGPFIAVNIPAIPAELIESELFGHEKGAFTGALQRRIGRFEEADKGTLFLDEIGEMKLELQSKLLRALQEKEIVRIGNNKAIKTDCRIIVATNKNLREEVNKGNFREDLYYRLMGLPINLPPLRDRKNDILILAQHFTDQFCVENSIIPKKLSNEVQRKLLGYSFPGNVRELKSMVELAVTLAGKDEIELSDVILEINPVAIMKDDSNLSLRDQEIRIIRATLGKYNNDVKVTAQKLKIGISTIYRLLKRDKGNNLQ